MLAALLGGYKERERSEADVEREDEFWGYNEVKIGGNVRGDSEEREVGEGREERRG